MSLSYRRDIDGLRALAILPVLFYHAGVSGFSGGYVGVDIFFVISGFLITGILAKNIAENNFSLLNFYERRIRRIFPALFGMLFVTTLAAGFFLLPTDLIAYGKSLASAALSLSNINFWQEGGYFNTSAITKPLLHTWSLSVEEQFYVVFPLCLFVTYRYLRWPLLWVWLAFAASLVLSIYGVRHAGEATFYLIPTRAWELLTGSLLALNAFPKPASQPLRNLLGLAGLALVAASVFFFTDATRFPGENALVPCLGAALLIYSGSGTSYTSRLLSLSPLVFVGLISYSLYLWHWPLLAFMHYLLPQPLSWLDTTCAIIGAFGMAVLSVEFLETPFRKGNTTVFTRNRRRIFLAAFILMGLAVAAGMGFKYARGLPHRLNPQLIVALQQAEASTEALKPCLNPGEKPNFKAPTAACTFTSQPGKPTNIVVWGDSHAAALAPAITGIPGALDQGVRILAMSGCYPLPNTELSYNQESYCRHFSDANLDYLLKGPEKTIIWTARWTNAVFGPRPGLTSTPATTLSQPEAKALFTARFTATLHQILATGKTLIVVDPVPEAPYDVPHHIALNYPTNPSTTLRMPMSPDTLRMDVLIDSLIAGTPAIHIKPQQALCNAQGCATFSDNEIYYSDSNHLSRAGEALLSPLFAPHVVPQLAPQQH